MRLALCIKKDLIGNLFLNQLLPALQDTETEVFLCDRVDDAERTASQETDFVFYERDLPVDHLYPALDQAQANDAKLYSFEGLARKHGIRIRTWGNINQAPAFDALRAFAPDLIAAVRYNYILQPAVIALAGRAVVNVHPGLLPAYAGVYPSFRALHNQAPEFGATLHYIQDARIDHGPILGQRSAPTRTDHSVLWHIREAYLLGASLLHEFLLQARNGPLPAGQAQDHANRSYYGYPTQQEFRALRARGIKLIDHQEYLCWLSGYAPD